MKHLRALLCGGVALAGASLLAVFFLMVALLPFDVSHNPDYLPTLFGP